MAEAMNEKAAQCLKQMHELAERAHAAVCLTLALTDALNQETRSTMKHDLHTATYMPNLLLNKLQECLSVGSDCAIAYKLDVSPSLVTGIRQRVFGLTDTFLVAVADATGLSTTEIRRMAGVEPDMLRPKEYRKKARRP